EETGRRSHPSAERLRFSGPADLLWPDQRRHPVLSRLRDVSHRLPDPGRLSAAARLPRQDRQSRAAHDAQPPLPAGDAAAPALLKRLHPDIPIVFGGISATYFHEELIRNEAVDFVLRGSVAEPSLLALV